MKTKIFRRLLLTSVLGILASYLVYKADIAPEPKYLLLGMFVCTYITALTLASNAIGMLLHAQRQVVRWLEMVFNQRGQKNISLLGENCCRGSTFFVNPSGTISNVLLPVDSLRIRNSNDNIKHPSIILHTSGPVRPVTKGLLVFHHDISRLGYLTNEELLNLIIKVANTIGPVPPCGPSNIELELALSELKERLRGGRTIDYGRQRRLFNKRLITYG